MNKNELIESIAKEASLSKKDAGAALDATLAAITKTLKKGGKVALIGFGTFSVVKRAARNGINPLTKQKIKIKAKNCPKFKAGAKLAKAV